MYKLVSSTVLISDTGMIVSGFVYEGRIPRTPYSPNSAYSEKAPVVGEYI